MTNPFSTRRSQYGCFFLSFHRTSSRPRRIQINHNYLFTITHASHWHGMLAALPPVTHSRSMSYSAFVFPSTRLSWKHTIASIKKKKTKKKVKNYTVRGAFFLWISFSHSTKCVLACYLLFTICRSPPFIARARTHTQSHSHTWPEPKTRR